MGTLTWFRAELPGEGVDEARLEFQDSNLRIRNIQWDIQTSRSYLVQIWFQGQLIYDAIHTTGSGSSPVAGNHQMVEGEDEAGTFLTIPPDITYSIKLYEPI